MSGEGEAEKKTEERIVEATSGGSGSRGRGRTERNSTLSPFELDRG